MLNRFVRPVLAGVAVVIAATIAAPLRAESWWQVRLQGVYGRSGSGFDFSDGGVVGAPDRLSIDTGNIDGWGLAVDYRFSERLGLSLSWIDGNVDSTVAATVVGISDSDDIGVGLGVFALGLDFDLLPGSRLDLLIGPSAARMDYSNPFLELTRLGLAEAIELDDQTTWGLHLRLDVPGKRWLLSVGAEWYDASAKVTNQDLSIPVEIALDPLLLTAGVGVRF